MLSLFLIAVISQNTLILCLRKGSIGHMVNFVINFINTSIHTYPTHKDVGDIYQHVGVHTCMYDTLDNKHVENNTFTCVKTCRFVVLMMSLFRFDFFLLTWALSSSELFYLIACCPSSVCPSVFLLNIYMLDFFFRTVKPILTKVGTNHS
jgi:hypothetical protein